ncbi:DUF721 domain-containing protein [Planctomicrobium sp. SH664]|uniref:DUF721 domain-containing protein n=1 Tax=Planctomicrobium sp. SH664 TaxID=3448125 RepID=UPI003F5C9EB2
MKEVSRTMERRKNGDSTPRRRTGSPSIKEGEPQTIGEVLSTLFALRGYGRVRSENQWGELWQKIVPAEYASQTRVLGVRNGVLSIGVANSALLSQLVAFHKVELFEKLKADSSAARIRDLKFVLRSR